MRWRKGRDFLRAPCGGRVGPGLSRVPGCELESVLWSGHAPDPTGSGLRPRPWAGGSAIAVWRDSWPPGRGARGSWSRRRGDPGALGGSGPRPLRSHPFSPPSVRPSWVSQKPWTPQVGLEAATACVPPESGAPVPGSLSPCSCWGDGGGGLGDSDRKSAPSFIIFPWGRPWRRGPGFLLLCLTALLRTPAARASRLQKVFRFRRRGGAFFGSRWGRRSCDLCSVLEGPALAEWLQPRWAV